MRAQLSAGSGSGLHDGGDQLGLVALDRDAELHLRARVLLLQRGGLLLHDLGKLRAIRRRAGFTGALARGDERVEQLVDRAGARRRLGRRLLRRRARRLVRDPARALVEPRAEHVSLVGPLIDFAHHPAPLLPVDLELRVELVEAELVVRLSQRLIRVLDDHLQHAALEYLRRALENSEEELVVLDAQALQAVVELVEFLVDLVLMTAAAHSESIRRTASAA